MAGFHSPSHHTIQIGRTVNDSPGLYVHIPFCLSRCGYCAFVSTVYSTETADAYIEAFAREVRQRSIFGNDVSPRTIFIGGGTPSCLSPRQLETVLRLLPQSEGEVSCEMNPDSANDSVLSLLREYGVTRCSFGVQTFSESGLEILGRRHNGRQARRAVEKALAAGFRSVNIDLINGWPGQTMDALSNDIDIAVNLGIQHISNYTFILEAEAAGYARFREAGETDGEMERRYWDFIEEYLEKNGFIHYETSNFSRPGHQCAHNVDIWKGKEYLGVGLGAHSYLGGRRFANTKNMEKYIQCSNVDDMEDYSETLPDEARARECAVFWLRLFEGICLPEFAVRTGHDFFALYGDRVNMYVEQGILEYAGDHVRVAKEYHPVLDAVLTDLV